MDNKRRATINISQEAKSQLDSVKASGQSYDGIIRELAKFWKEKKTGQILESAEKVQK